MAYSVNIEALQEEIEQSGVSMTALAKNSDMKRVTLYNRLNGVGEFTASEIAGIAHALRLSNKQRDAIFFVKQV